MGFSGNGMSSIRMNHGMLSTRGATFKKHRKYINVDVDLIKVDEALMERIAKDARNAALIKLAISIVIAALMVIAMSFL